MKTKPSLLSQIKSKHILQKILIYAHSDIRSVLKLIKYNKNLLNKLDINIKDYYKYKIEKSIIKEYEIGAAIILTTLTMEFILFLIYIILFYAKGTFNEKNLKEGYNEKKKKFVDFMDNYILLTYFGFIIISIILNLLLNLLEIIAVKGRVKLISAIFCFLVFLTHYIFHFIKINYTANIIKEELLNPKDKEESKHLPWFYVFDIILIFSFMISLIGHLPYMVLGFEDDEKHLNLKQINGINNISLKIPLEFSKLNKREKNEFIFKKGNISNYLDKNKINIIKNINDIRKQNNIPDLKFEFSQQLPNFIINPRTELIFYENHNIYKITNNLYIFKYNKNEFQNLVNNKEILNIITIDFLDRINIIEQNNNELIYIYNNNANNNINRLNNNNDNDINNANIQIPKNHIINTEDKLKDKDTSLNFTEIDDEKESEQRIIKNIKINKNAFEKQ